MRCARPGGHGARETQQTGRTGAGAEELPAIEIRHYHFLLCGFCLPYAANAASPQEKRNFSRSRFRAL
jgi:hypothetical protein